MKLKQLLYEDEQLNLFGDKDFESMKEYAEVDKLYKFMQREVHPACITDFLIYRGIDPDVYPVTYKKYSIRKDRVPKDTLIFFDTLLDVARRADYDDIPDRHEVAFCSPDYNNASSYGDTVIVFVPKSAEIWQSDYEDSIEVIQSLDVKELYYPGKDLEEQMKLLQEYSDELYDFVDIIVNQLDVYWHDSEADVLVKRHHSILDDLESVQDDNIFSTDFIKYVLRPIYEWYADDLHQYFASLDLSHNKLKNGYGEVQIDAEYYYGVNHKWFFDNFKYNGKQWLPKYYADLKM